MAIIGTPALCTGTLCWSSQSYTGIIQKITRKPPKKISRSDTKSSSNTQRQLSSITMLPTGFTRQTPTQGGQHVQEMAVAKNCLFMPIKQFLFAF